MRKLVAVKPYLVKAIKEKKDPNGPKHLHRIRTVTLIKPLPSVRKYKVKVTDILQGVVARVLFLFHSVTGVALVIATGELNDASKYAMPLVVGPQIIEAFITLWYRRGREWKWATPCIVFHIISAVPAIWVLELTEVEKRLQSRRLNDTAARCIDVVMDGRKDGFSDISDWANYMVTEFCSCGNCIQIMVQSLLLLLVIGRWLCPRSGTVSVSQKAIMLFHNFAVTSDILDLFRLLKEDKVKYSPMLVTVTLCLWTSGIIQIAIVVSAKKEGSKFCGSCLENGVWAILAVLFLDDVPFLAFRFVLIIHYRVFSYTIFFFTCKNLLLTALNTNKLIAIAHEHRVKAENEKMLDNFKQLVLAPASQARTPGLGRASSSQLSIIRPSAPPDTTVSEPVTLARVSE